MKKAYQNQENHYIYKPFFWNACKMVNNKSTFVGQFFGWTLVFLDHFDLLQSSK